jgi:hypothetical protein
VKLQFAADNGYRERSQGLATTGRIGGPDPEQGDERARTIVCRGCGMSPDELSTTVTPSSEEDGRQLER